MENNILKFSYDGNAISFEDVVSSLKKYTEEFVNSYKFKNIGSFDKKSDRMFDKFCGNLLYKYLKIDELDKTLGDCRKLIKNDEEKEAAKKISNKKSGIPMFVENLNKLEDITKIINDFDKKKSKQGNDGNKTFKEFSKKVKTVFGNKLIENNDAVKYFYDNCLETFCKVCEKNKIKTTLDSLKVCEENIKKYTKNKSAKNTNGIKNVSISYPKFVYKKQSDSIRLTPIIKACQKYVVDWRKKFGNSSSDYNMHLIYDYLDFEGLGASIEECKDMIIEFKNKKSKSEREKAKFTSNIRDKLSSNGYFNEKMSLTMIIRKSVFLNNLATGSFTKYYKNKNSKTETQFNGDYEAMVSAANRTHSVKERDEFVEKHLASFISIVSKLPSVFSRDENFMNCAEDIGKLK